MTDQEKENRMIKAYKLNYKSFRKTLKKYKRLKHERV